MHINKHKKKRKSAKIFHKSYNDSLKMPTVSLIHIFKYWPTFFLYFFHALKRGKTLLFLSLCRTTLFKSVMDSPENEKLYRENVKGPGTLQSFQFELWSAILGSHTSPKMASSDQQANKNRLLSQQQRTQTHDRLDCGLSLCTFKISAQSASLSPVMAGTHSTSVVSATWPFFLCLPQNMRLKVHLVWL